MNQETIENQLTQLNADISKTADQIQQAVDSTTKLALINYSCEKIKSKNILLQLTAEAAASAHASNTNNIYVYISSINLYFKTIRILKQSNYQTWCMRTTMNSTRSSWKTSTKLKQSCRSCK